MSTSLSTYLCLVIFIIIVIYLDKLLSESLNNHQWLYKWSSLVKLVMSLIVWMGGYIFYVIQVDMLLKND